MFHAKNKIYLLSKYDTSKFLLFFGFMMSLNLIRQRYSHRVFCNLGKLQSLPLTCPNTFEKLAKLENNKFNIFSKVQKNYILHPIIFLMYIIHNMINIII